MTTLKGHFDGTAIVLDEPAELTVGQAVQIIVEAPPAETGEHSPRLSTRRSTPTACGGRGK